VTKGGIPLTVLLCALAQQPAPPTVRSRTTLVPVDVRVVDGSGKPITDLKKEDFTVLENGVPQDVRLFTTHAVTAVEPSADGSSAALPLRRELAPGGAPELPNARVFLIAFGRGRLQAPMKGVDAMIGFVKTRLLPQDRVAVMAWNRATDLTTDRAALLATLERFKKDHTKIESDLQQYFSGLRAVFSHGEIPPEIQAEIDAVFARTGSRALAGRGSEIARLADQRRTTIDDLMSGDAAAELAAMDMGLDEYAATTLKAAQETSSLYAAIRYLKHFDGDKHVIFVNEGGIFLPRLEDDRSLAAFASDARVTINTIRTGGLMTMSPLVQKCPTCPLEVDVNNLGRVSPMQMSANQTVRNIAELSGGVSTAYGSVDKLLDDIDRASRFEYLLGYVPANAAWDGRYRRITVKVNRKDARVLYRHGYYASESFTPANRKDFLTYTRIAAAGGSALPVTELGVSAAAEYAKADREVVLKVTLKVDGVQFTIVDGRHKGSIQIATFCGTAAEAVVGESWQTIDLNLSEETFQKVIAEGLPYTQRVPVRAAPAYVKVIAYDYGSDRTGSAVVTLSK
jgi:VWFA-related protein